MSLLDRGCPSDLLGFKEGHGRIDHPAGDPYGLDLPGP